MKIQFGFVVVGSLILSGAVNADTVTNSKAAELALHRLERLVILKKVDASYQSKLRDIKVEDLAHATPDDPSFKVSLSEFPGVDGTQKKLEIIMNEAGRATSFHEVTGTESLTAPTWGSIDATTLAEDSLHFILDNTGQKPELAPFFNSMSSSQLIPIKDAAGSDAALLLVQAGSKYPILHITVKLDGTFESYQLVPVSME